MNDMQSSLGATPFIGTVPQYDAGTCIYSYTGARAVKKQYLHYSPNPRTFKVSNLARGVVNKASHRGRFQNLPFDQRIIQ